MRTHYVLSSVTFALIVCGTVLWLCRRRVAPLLPARLRGYMRVGPADTSAFTQDIEAGFTSRTFNLLENVFSGDSRGGLEEAGKREIARIMREQGCEFDEARRIMNQQNMERNNVDPRTGIPRDPRFVSFDTE